MKIFGFLFLILSVGAFAQQNVDLLKEYELGNIKAVNREISKFSESANAIELNAVEGDGLGMLSTISFEEGVIEFELMGENNPGRSWEI